MLQAQQVLDTANASIPDLERAIGQEEDAISTSPSSLLLLERRPDIRQAEQNLIAANAGIGVPKAEFFPQVSLTGGGGVEFS